MNILGDWRLWLFVVSLVKDFVLVIGIMLVKFNDLKHLDTDMKEIKSHMKENNKLMTIFSERISHIEGKLSK